ncbi:hypothetical protein vseg_017472 [Gypsophila vaccaria]
MAPPTLDKVGREAFMLLDQFEAQRGQPSRGRDRNYNTQSRQNHGYYPSRERIITSEEAARIFGGLVICDHYAKKKPSYGKAF